MQFKVKHDQLYANVRFYDMWRMQSAIHIMDFHPLHGFAVQNVNVFLFIIKIEFYLSLPGMYANITLHPKWTQSHTHKHTDS